MYTIILNFINIFIQCFTISIIISEISVIKIHKKHILTFTIILLCLMYLFVNFKIANMILPFAFITTTLYFYIILKKLFYSAVISSLTFLILASSDILSGFTLMFVSNLLIIKLKMILKYRSYV